jgi:hypothetical protein
LGEGAGSSFSLWPRLDSVDANPFHC